MAKEEGRRLKRGLELVHPANHGFYRTILAELPRARLSGNFRRMTLLNTVLVTLERYPMPIRNVQDAVVLAGVGDLTVMSFEASIKKRGLPIVTSEQSVAHAEKVFTRLRTFLANTDFTKEPDITPGEWRPLRYSNAWTFIMILGLFSNDNGRLGVDDILGKCEELRRYIPRCKLSGLSCIRSLIERGLVDYLPVVNLAKKSKSKAKDNDNDTVTFSSKRKRRYTYGLTASGRRLAEDIISGCEVPISLKASINALMTQPTMTQQGSGDEIEASVASSYQGEDEDAEEEDDNDIHASDDDYNEESYDHVDTEMDVRMTKDINASCGGNTVGLLHQGGETPTRTPTSKMKSQPHLGDALDALMSYKCNDPSQYVAPPPTNFGNSEAGREVISIADSESSSSLSVPLKLSELRDVISMRRLQRDHGSGDGTKSKSPHSFTSEGLPNSQDRPMTTLNGLIGEHSNIGELESRTSMCRLGFDDMVSSIALDNSMYDVSSESDKELGKESEGFRTPRTSRISVEMADLSKNNVNADNEDFQDSYDNVDISPSIGTKHSILNTSPLFSEADHDPYDVTSDKYRRLMEGCEEIPHCYTQWNNNESDGGGAAGRGHRVGTSPPLIRMHNSDDDSGSYKQLGGGDNSIFLGGSPIKGGDKQLESGTYTHPLIIGHVTDQTVKDEVHKCIDSASQSSQGSEGEPLDPLSQLPSTPSRPTAIHASTPSPCDRFLPLSQRLQQKYGIDLTPNVGSYEVITVVDNREVHDADGRYQRRITEIFAEAGKTVVFRQLPLGDVIWVLRFTSGDGNQDGGMLKSPGVATQGSHESKAKSSPDPDHTGHNNTDCTTPTASISRSRKGDASSSSSQKNDELAESFVLDWVVERKTTADLMASISDGRYEDQKLRMLRLVGFRHVCYLFEDIEAGAAVGRVSSLNKGVNSAAIASARIHTQLVTGFNVIRTTGMSHTASNILLMHKHIERCVRERIRDVAIASGGHVGIWLENNHMKFHAWDVRNRRQNQMTFLELFGKQLRAIPGCGADTTQAILDAWPTPFLLSQELKSSNLAYVNEALAAHCAKRKRAPISNNLYATLRALYVHTDREETDAQHR